MENIKLVPLANITPTSNIVINSICEYWYHTDPQLESLSYKLVSVKKLSNKTLAFYMDPSAQDKHPNPILVKLFGMQHGGNILIRELDNKPLEAEFVAKIVNPILKPIANLSETRAKVINEEGEYWYHTGPQLENLDYTLILEKSGVKYYVDSSKKYAFPNMFTKLYMDTTWGGNLLIIS